MKSISTKMHPHSSSVVAVVEDAMSVASIKNDQRRSIPNSVVVSKGNGRNKDLMRVATIAVLLCALPTCIQSLTSSNHYSSQRYLCHHHHNHHNHHNQNHRNQQHDIALEPISKNSIHSRVMTLFMSLKEEQHSSSSNNDWSRAATTEDITEAAADTSSSNNKGSRFGVRSRVRSVLAKAKNRTGISNSSQSPQSVIAEAASIGGLGGVLVDEKGTVDVALDYQVNGDATTNTNIINANTNTINGEYKSKKKTAPASTPSPLPVTITPGPEDRLTPRGIAPNTAAAAAANNNRNNDYSEMDALSGDVSAAFSLPPPPLPFSLPTLTPEQQRLLRNGERVQFQSDMGNEGSGFVVVDVNAPPDAVWDCLLDFESYPETIPTVRSVQMYTNTKNKKNRNSNSNSNSSSNSNRVNGSKPVVVKHGVPSVTRAAFTLSKFRLRIAAIHKYRPHPQGDYMVFTLDPASTNLVLQNAKGVWHTQRNVDGRQGITRVWLLCELKVSSMLPVWIVDYAAKRAMPRATTWLKPQVEAAASLWLRKKKEDE